jgi:hypothetical protein
MTTSKANDDAGETTWKRLVAGILIRAVEPEDAPGVTALMNLPGYRWGTMRLPHQSVSTTRQKNVYQRAEFRMPRGHLERRDSWNGISNAL